VAEEETFYLQTTEAIITRLWKKKNIFIRPKLSWTWIVVLLLCILRCSGRWKLEKNNAFISICMCEVDTNAQDESKKYYKTNELLYLSFTLRSPLSIIGFWIATHSREHAVVLSSYADGDKVSLFVK
jgi:hypothetical protein